MQDVLQACGAMPAEDHANAKALLDRIDLDTDSDSEPDGSKEP